MKAPAGIGIYRVVAVTSGLADGWHFMRQCPTFFVEAASEAEAQAKGESIIRCAQPLADVMVSLSVGMTEEYRSASGCGKSVSA